MVSAQTVICPGKWEQKSLGSWDQKRINQSRPEDQTLLYLSRRNCHLV